MEIKLANTPEEIGISTAGIEHVRNFMNNGVRNGDCDGAVLAIARHGELAMFEAFGHSDEARTKPIRPDDIFLLMSMSKAFCAAEILHLADLGELDLLDPVTKYIPEYGVNGKQNTTIHQLLNHTAGLWSALTGMPGMAFGDEGNLEKAVKAVCASSPAHVPGTRALYSPWAGYAILGEIVRRIKGGKKSYSECVREDIFGPLGMDDTDYGYHGNPERRVDLYLRAEGMKAAFAALNDSYKGDAELPGANAHGTAMDCMRFAEMLRNKGTLNGARILAPLTVDYAYRNHTGDMPHDFWTNEQIDRGISVFPANFTLAGGYARGEGDYFNVCAAAASPNAFAAIGAGSTMLMVDFEKQLSVVLLTAGINNGMSHFLRVRRLNNVIYSTLR